jgi:hypothetical protein
MDVRRHDIDSEVVTVLLGGELELREKEHLWVADWYCYSQTFASDTIVWYCLPAVHTCYYTYVSINISIVTCTDLHTPPNYSNILRMYANISQHAADGMWGNTRNGGSCLRASTKPARQHEAMHSTHLKNADRQQQRRMVHSIFKKNVVTKVGILCASPDCATWWGRWSYDTRCSPFEIQQSWAGTAAVRSVKGLNWLAVLLLHLV